MSARLLLVKMTSYDDHKTINRSLFYFIVRYYGIIINKKKKKRRKFYHFYETVNPDIICHSSDMKKWSSHHAQSRTGIQNYGENLKI